MPREWNSSQYHQLSDPQFQWGLKVLDRLELRGDETVLDAGCGTGRVTAELAKRLPHGKVIASDVSENMIRSARETLSQFGKKVRFLPANMADLPLENEVDVIFSTAAFHWVEDHDALFRSLFRALRPGGKLVAQCGGGANLEKTYERAKQVIAEKREFAQYFRDFREPVHFASPEQTSGRLRRAGFADAEAWLEFTPTTIGDSQTYREFLQTVVLRAHIAKLPVEGAEYLLHRMRELGAEDDPAFTLDYWRLNIHANKT
jgi:trans-aconitate 2-methyltransferase